MTTAPTWSPVDAGLVAYTGDYELSDDTQGGNTGKPCRVMRWIGGAA